MKQTCPGGERTRHSPSRPAMRRSGAHSSARAAELPSRSAARRSGAHSPARAADRPSETIRWSRLLVILVLGSVSGVALGATTDALAWPEPVAHAIAAVIVAVLAVLTVTHALPPDLDR